MTKDSWYLDLAHLVSQRATCDRLAVGCVLVRDDNVLSVGFNGAPSGMPHCDEVNHGYPEGERVESCRVAVHAESNAVALAAKHGASVKGATAYVTHSTHSPCEGCLGLLINAGVSRIVYRREYKSSGEFNVSIDIEREK